ncbi:uncharacterized protein LOC100852726 [Vitis vinifera]|uniref:uncharacterized protein LOC100852726 n=1 Tax=Vitis vinifera TaxID=29760 RepID=UPI002883036C|nr:uncharacterized protein LOC100852726 [Vitis vinifera]
MTLNLSPTYNSHSSEDFAQTDGNITQAFGAMDVGSFDFSQNLQVIVSEDNNGEALLEENSKDHDPDSSPISADDIFFNGQIRPMFPLFNRDLLFADSHEGDSEASGKASPLRPPLRKLFVEKSEHPSSSSSSESDELEGVAPETYCAWSEKAVEASPGACKKSSSTGFSKFWRFRDLVLRSNSDGKDAFVFLDPSAAKAKTVQTDEKVERAKKIEKTEVSVEKINSGDGKVGGGKVKGEKRVSAHESLYIKNRALREGGRRKSYLPYRQDLVGFFTNVNGLSRNVHPF